MWSMSVESSCMFTFDSLNVFDTSLSIIFFRKKNMVNNNTNTRWITQYCMIFLIGSADDPIKRYAWSCISIVWSSFGMMQYMRIFQVCACVLRGSIMSLAVHVITGQLILHCLSVTHCCKLRILCIHVIIGTVWSLYLNISS